MLGHILFVVVIFFILLPSLLALQWTYSGTNVNEEPVWARLVVGTQAAFAAVFWGLVLLGAVFAGHPHVVHARRWTATHVHPGSGGPQ